MSDVKRIVYYVCPNCGRRIREEHLVWTPEVDADEMGCYVYYVGRCPNCYEEITWKSGYKTDCHEPLRHEW